MQFRTRAAALLAALTSSLASAQQPEATALRGVWIPLTDCELLGSPAATAAGMAKLAALGVNVVFPVVWTRGYPLYPSHRFAAAAPPANGSNTAILPGLEGRDPLRDVLVEAHRHGIEVVPWFEYGFAAGHRFAPGTLLDHHPDWALRDAQGEVFEKNGFRWLDGLHPEVQDLLADCILEVCAEYDIDGVQGDDRLPALPTGARPSPGSRERLQGLDGDALASRRARLLSDWLATLRTRIRAIDTHLVLSLSPSIHDFGLRQYSQDGPAWCRRGLGDWLHPQTYRKDEAATRAVLTAAVSDYPIRADQVLTSGLLLRVGSYSSSPDLLRYAIETSRSAGMQGEVLFHAQALLEPGGNLAAIIRSSWTGRAAVPGRAKGWRPVPRLPERISAEPGKLEWQFEIDALETVRVHAFHDGKRPTTLELRHPNGHVTTHELASGVAGWQLLGRVSATTGVRTKGSVLCRSAAPSLRVLALRDRR